MSEYEKLILMKLLNKKLHSENIIEKNAFEKMECKINQKLIKLKAQIDVA